MKVATLGKILGALGLLLLLSSPYTYFVTTGLGWPAAAKAAIGVIFVGIFFATNFQQLGQFASGRSTFFFASSAVMVVLVIAALVAVNYIAVKKNKSWDLTSKNIFTLSPQTLSTLKGLKEPVKALGFVDPSDRLYDITRDLLERYHREAPDKFEYAFKDPRKAPDLAEKYKLSEAQPSLVLVRGEGDKETHTSVNLMMIGDQGEQDLTNALIKLNAVGEQKVYFLTGHGERLLPKENEAPAAEDEGEGLSEMKRQLLSEGYAPAPLPLLGKDEVPKDASLIVVAGPRTPIRPTEVVALRKYLEQGGRLLYFADATGAAGPEMDKLLADHGVQIDPGIVADPRFAVGSPYNVVSMFYGEHETVRLLKQREWSVQFPMARGLSVLREGMLPGVKVEPVVLTSPFAWEETKPDEEPSLSNGEKAGQLPLVALSTRSTAEAQGKRFDEARVAVFGDADLLIDANWGHEPNRNLVMNALAWASNEVSKITIRPPDRDISTLDIDAVMMAKIKFLATDVLPLTLLGVGIAVWLTRRNK